jgi:ribosomal protein S18 acetylase RimI-like enzyme
MQICALNDNEVVGILLFSYNQNCLSCLAVHPEHRNNGIASKMIEEMISVLSPDRGIRVITFRDDDEKGTAPRALYKRFGFKEDELCFEHNYPHQKFMLYRI